MDDLDTQKGRRRALVEILQEQGADVIDVLDAQSPVPSRVEYRDFIFGQSR